MSTEPRDEQWQFLADELAKSVKAYDALKKERDELKIYLMEAMPMILKASIVEDGPVVRGMMITWLERTQEALAGAVKERGE